MKILIVDDHQRIRETIKLLVSDLADDIMEVSDGTEAVAACTLHKPDWILMDIEMKEMDGIEATKKIKAIYPEARILVLTSFDDDFMRAAALAAGAFGFVLKDNLAEAIRFIEGFPVSRPAPSSNRDRTSSQPPAPRRNPTPPREDETETCSVSATQTVLCDVGENEETTQPLPTSQRAPDVWAASCRDCAIHALAKLSELESQSDPIRRAVQAIRRSLDPQLWLDETQLEPTKGRRAFTEWREAVRALGQVPAEPVAKKMWWGQPRWVNLEAIEDLLQGAALLMAQTMQRAVEAGAASNPLQQEQVDDELSKAQMEISRANAKAADNQYDLAVLQYGKAWLHASFAASLSAPAKN